MFHMIYKRALLVEVSYTLIRLNFHFFQNNFASFRGPNQFCSAWKDFSWRPCL